MNIITDSIRQDNEYQVLKKTVSSEFSKEKPNIVSLSGLTDGARNVLLFSLIEDLRKERDGLPSIIICSEEKECVALNKMLNDFGLHSAFYLNRDLILYNITASHEYEHERLKVLFGIQNKELDVVIMTPDSALSYTMPPEVLNKNTIEIDSKKEYNIDDLQKRLINGGYVRVDLVDGKGQFAKRGCILDVFPPSGYYIDQNGEKINTDLPIRIEFFGDEIDRMGVFDVETQRLIESVDMFMIPPSREILYDEKVLQDIKKAILDNLKLSNNETAIEEMTKEIASIDGMSLENGGLKFVDKYITLVYPERKCIFDYLTDKTLNFVIGTNALKERIKSFEFQTENLIKELLENGTILPKYTDYSKPTAFVDLFLDRGITLHIDNILSRLSGRKMSGLFTFKTKHTISYDDKQDLLFEDIENYKRAEYSIVVLCENETYAKNLCGLLNEKGIEATLDKENQSEKIIKIIFDTKIQGFELTNAKFVVLSTIEEQFGRGINSISSKMRKRKKKDNKKAILSYNELTVGDIVVHETYGIGKYIGMTNLTTDGVKRDYITIQYAGSDKLFMPVEKLDMVSKYIGAHSDDGLVKLSKFGGAEWNKAKAKAKGAVKEMAKELISLYAKRMRSEGFSYPEDDELQRDFDSSFEYSETDSQLEAINDIKEDMISTTPMDRLLCGDVGFGKTEVAFRAAYKAVLGGKQVAILCPTTILALQHYQTAISRFRSFGVNVDMISRFRNTKQQSATKRALRRGDVDIIIGTHRLISSDIEFHDLGLLIVDEEQRFGVAQKEKLKKMSANIDVLSLSATPIPRTLNMAMGGLRDISVLDEAPIDRVPTQTYVLEDDELIISEAIKRELRRGGQIFYLHNNVDTIYLVASNLRSKFPDYNITVAHGKMDKEELEEIWGNMLKGEIDILVSTTIIETGVDVPNANTLIVDNAQRLGLSQLHQIRGRVGRSARRAYAYFTYPKNMALSEIAQKRLEAIRDYAEFGAGFKIAMRDMELRGVGNLLGSEQHGHLDAVGYELYIKLLNEAVLEERGEKIKELPECTLKLNFSAFIPENYVQFPAQRMALYKKIAMISSNEDRMDIADEITDIYGDMPKSVDDLLMIALIKANAIMCDISSIEEENDIYRIYQNKINIDVWSMLFETEKGKLKIVSSGKPFISLNLREEKNQLEHLNSLLERYKKAEEKEKIEQ